jgi:predicted small lipoprotein YifL
MQPQVRLAATAANRMPKENLMKKILVFAAVVSLAGCGKGPSESEMNKAVKKSIDDSNRQMASIGFGSAFSSEVPEVKKLGCKEDGDNAFRCDIEINGKAGKKVVPARFVKGSDGWVITN